MPTRLRPTNPVAGNAILVGDPGRALLLAQELLDDPKMSNHARGLWGYTGPCAIAGAGANAGAGGSRAELSVQTTGIGAPSAATVLGDLAKLGVRRAVRVGTCRALRETLQPGDCIVVAEALTTDGTTRALTAHAGTASGGGVAHDGGAADGEEITARPDAELLERLAPAGSVDRVLSGDLYPVPSPEVAGDAGPAWCGVADLQTGALLTLGAQLGIRIGAVLVVEWDARGERLESEALDDAVKRAGHVAVAALTGDPQPQSQG